MDNSLLDTQWQLGQMIDRFLINMKKDGPNRRRNAEYISGHWETITQYWRQFEITHKQLAVMGITDDKYFTEDFFGKVKKSYEDALDLLQGDRQALAATSSVAKTPNNKGVAANVVGETSSAATRKPSESGHASKESESDAYATSETDKVTSITQNRSPQTVEQGEIFEENTAKIDQAFRYRRQEVRYRTFEKHMEEVLKNDGNSLHKSYYEFKRKLLIDTWDKISSLYEEIVIHEANEAQLKENWEKFSVMEAKFQETIILLEHKINNLTTTNEAQVGETGVRLPQITLPTFDGSYKSWTPFHDIYYKMVHSQKNLANAIKMQYLKCHIKGEASRLIQHLEISNANYEAAWKLLCNRYNNKRYLLSTHLDNLLNQAVITRESAQELKNLHDKTQEALQAIESLKIDTNSWGPLLAHIVIRKLDKETFRLYEQSLRDPKDLPDFNDLLSFLENRFQSLEAIESVKKREPERRLFSQKTNQPFQSYHTTVLPRCTFCNGPHSMFKCTKQNSMSPKQKLDAVKRNKLCTNCLRKGHDVIKCTSKSTCLKCRLKHNTLLHDEEQSQSMTQVKQTSGVVTLTSTRKPGPSEVLLATAMIQIEANDGTTRTMKALIDQGSQASFISEKAAQSLGLKRTKTNIMITGIHSQYKNPAYSYVAIKILPRFTSNFETITRAFVLDKLTQLAPEVSANTDQWHHLHQIILADPDYTKQGKIDVILGADVYGEIILDGVLKGPENSPVAQQTELGWIVSGKCGTKSDGIITSMITTIDLEEIKGFWEIEEISEEREMTEEDKKCIEHFENTVSRDKEGKYIVRLPFNKTICPASFGDSKRLAISRLLSMERKFRADKQLESEYKEFMQQYLDLGHMQMSNSDSNYHGPQYYLPHHAVRKEDSKTTKLRVVFDASAKTSKGESLNSTLCTGPQLQPTLHDILLQWRRHKFVFKADIEKMFRQIKIHEEDQAFQKILWRFSETEPIKEYKLTTVTYGTRPAPFLAVKTMHHLATQQSKIFPKGANAIYKNFYMDDLLSGAHSIEEARQTIYETRQLLKGAGFHLRQWSSNNSKILQDIPTDQRETVTSEINFSESIKTLGLHWNPHSDVFLFKVNIPTTKVELTKRTLLSEASKLFDPIGWLAPTIIRAKIIFQELWNLGLDWDDKLPENIATRWQEYKQDLIILEKLTIPRWVNCRTMVTPCELHGFSDASERAYSAVIYIRTHDSAGNIQTHLISAKTKVAPIRNKTSLPRLELCAALLLTNLMKKVVKAMDIPFARQYAWTDSEIVLAWIRGNPNKYKTFVANRVAKIQAALKQNQWFHVKSSENPADCASRGISATALVNHPLWWNGPQWLKGQNINYKQEAINTTYEEIKKTTLTFSTFIKREIVLETIERFSTFRKATRVLGYCLRFIENCKKNKTIGPLTTKEVQQSTAIIIKAVQEKAFPDEIEKIKRKQPISSKSALLSFNPFIDESGLMRVGGRLENSELSFEAKHPIILPYKSHFTNLVINYAHERTMHGGTSLTLAYTRNKYWILKGYSATKQQLKSCMICARMNARSHEQLMGNLPRPRLRITRPFTNTGVDYAGPILIKSAKGRGTKTFKGYIAVFVCLATKAIHLEAVSDLTSNAFIGAFKRFVSRRGIPHTMFSDNATNFQLANKILQKTQAEFKANYTYKLQEELSSHEIEWKFIPPAAPHFGGLWEAGVKSMKNHLKKVLGSTPLTYEEISTVLANIEACLNSRPLCPMTDDPTDLSVLTPGHFLTGSALLAPPGKDTDLTDINIRSRWQLLEKLNQQIWNKWSKEYLHRLQCRPKWTSRKEEVKTNDLVLVKDEALPPGRWPLARVEEIHPGQDNITRVVTLRMKNKLIKRPIIKICTLPVNNLEEEDSSTKKGTERI